MSWASAVKKSKSMVAMGGGRQFSVFRRPDIPQHTPDWARLVSLDFETFWDAGKMTYEDGIAVTLEDGEEYYIIVNKYE